MPSRRTFAAAILAILFGTRFVTLVLNEEKNKSPGRESGGAGSLGETGPDCRAAAAADFLSGIGNGIRRHAEPPDLRRGLL